jgi:hypothetical protein
MDFGSTGRPHIEVALLGLNAGVAEEEEELARGLLFISEITRPINNSTNGPHGGTDSNSPLPLFFTTTRACSALDGCATRVARIRMPTRLGPCSFPLRVLRAINRIFIFSSAVAQTPTIDI